MELSSPGRVNHFNEDICSENYTNHQSTPIIFVDSSVVNTNCAEEITEEVNSNHNETNPLEVLCFDRINVENDVKAEPLENASKADIQETGGIELRFQCDICLKNYFDRKSLAAHKRTHDIVKRYKCQYCPKTFDWGSNWKQHERTHTGIRSFECKGCYITYTACGSLIRHKKICSKWQELNKSTAKNLDNLFETECFSCKVCSKEFSTKQKLHQHKQIHNAKQLKCKFCPKTFRTEYILKTHERIHTGEQPYMCSWCPLTFSHQSSYCRHKKLCRNRLEQAIEMNEFEGINELESMSSVENDSLMEDETEVQLCADDNGNHEATTEAKDDPEQDIIPNDDSVHQIEEVQIVQEIQIENIIIKEEEYEEIQVQNTIIEEAPLKNSATTLHKCQFCPKTFRLGYILRIHERIHTGEEPFMCSWCPQRFSHQSSFCRHKKRCRLKHQSIDSDTLEKVHVNEVAQVKQNRRRKSVHKCRFCPKTYSQRLLLNIHERSHTGEQPFKCPTCSMKFSYPSSYCRHKKKCRETLNQISKPSNGEVCGSKDVEQSSSFKCVERSQLMKATTMAENSQEADQSLEHQSNEIKVEPIEIYDKDTVKSVRKSVKANYMPFQCKYCTKVFNTKLKIEIHERTHTGERPFKCPLCSLTFANPASFCRHKKLCRLKLKIKSASERETPNETDQLLKATETIVRTHSKKISATDMDQMHKCRFCSKKYFLKNNMIVHERIHTGEKPYECPTCFKKFSNPTSFCRHKKSCQLMSLIAEQMELSDAMKSDYGSKEPSSSFSAADQSHLIDATNSQVNNQIQESKDNQSERKLNSINSRRTIRKFRSDVVSNYILNNTTDLQKSVADTLFPCQYCAKIIRFKHNLKIHERSHTGERPFKCPLCSLTFAHPASFCRHKKRCKKSKSGSDTNSITNSDGFEEFLQNFGNFDDDSSQQNDDLSVDIGKSDTNADTECTIDSQSRINQIESDKNVFNCNFCCEIFSTNSKFKEHLKREHPNQKGYKCKYCSKSFKAIEGLRVHEVKHTGKRRFECWICSATFSEMSSLCRHKKMCERKRRERGISEDDM